MTKPTIRHDPAEAKAYFEDKLAFTTDPENLEQMLKSDEVNVIDVRNSEEFAKEHIVGAINLPKDQWTTTQGLRKDKINVLYCSSHVCHLAATAAVTFAGQGFPVMELEGGWRCWKEHGFAVASGEHYKDPSIELCLCGLTVASCTISDWDSRFTISQAMPV